MMGKPQGTVFYGFSGLKPAQKGQKTRKYTENPKIPEILLPCYSEPRVEEPHGTTADPQKQIKDRQINKNIENAKKMIQYK